MPGVSITDDILFDFEDNFDTLLCEFQTKEDDEILAIIR